MLNKDIYKLERLSVDEAGNLYVINYHPAHAREEIEVYTEEISSKTKEQVLNEWLLSRYDDGDGISNFEDVFNCKHAKFNQLKLFEE